ncbi:hypothetical protein DBZ36_13270 [Alginatibacterium sediminis]|uniref:Uncharacterized protein n=1 Tax=Alginatibacterium sediminis TaxID=2164068 RepID=A0A420E9S2_9ALTE|nr:hypothetical protein [Alginatibacterium sediminis]RKF17422.1 hypothetical protein DBZ36_13270 [Alginatibacterium sediminis]
MFNISNSIQFGFDVATSITIIATAVSWAYSQKKRAQEEAQKGVDQRVRSTCLKTVQSVLREMENEFSSLIDESTAFESKIDRLIKVEDGEVDFSRLIRALQHDSEFVENSTQQLGKIRSRTGEFYEIIQKRRYTLLPMLMSIDTKGEYIQVFEANVSEIAQAYNRLGSGYISLLREVGTLIVLIGDLQAPEGDEKIGISTVIADEKCLNRVKSILFDEDYYDWIQLFVPAGEEKTYLKEVIEPDTVENHKLANIVFQNFINHMIDEGDRMQAQILRYASREVTKARIECKDILIALSAISCKLVSKGSVGTLHELIEEFETDRYFGRDNKIR